VDELDPPVSRPARSSSRSWAWPLVAHGTARPQEGAMLGAMPWGPWGLDPDQTETDVVLFGLPSGYVKIAIENDHL